MQPTGHRDAARRHWLDAALIVVLAAATLLWSDALFTFGDPDFKVVLAFGSVEAWRTHVIVWCLAGVPSAVAIPLRHTWPLTAMLLAAGSAGFHLFDEFLKSPPMDVAVLVTMYTLAGSAHARRTVLAVLVAAEVLLVVGCLANEIGVAPGPRDTKSPATYAERLDKHLYAILHGDAMGMLSNVLRAAVVPALLLAATWAVADNARTRRAHLATLQARADDLEREHQQRTALAVATERSRITRELHDVVAHGLSIMVVQAQGARAMLSRQPERTETALTDIVTTGRASLAEMRRLLGLIRTEPGVALTPQPSLATLPDLIDRVRDSGTRVDFQVSGEPATLPAVIELAVYRIVQEALTNSLKHATPGAECAVALEFHPEFLGIRVADTGEPGPPPVAGNGLRGITERVHALGGDLRTGPGLDGGFEVSARLPVAVGTGVHLAARERVA